MPPRNPFQSDPDLAAIWEMLMPRHFADIDAARFLGIHAHNSAGADDRTAFPTLDAYRDEWLR